MWPLLQDSPTLHAKHSTKEPVRAEMIKQWLYYLKMSQKIEVSSETRACIVCLQMLFGCILSNSRIHAFLSKAKTVQILFWPTVFYS